MAKITALSKHWILPILLAILSYSPGLTAEADTRYRVTGVESWDVLNVRAEPQADAARVGTIPPSGRGIRVVGDESEAAAQRGSWIQIEYNGITGWVNDHYLMRDQSTAEQDGQTKQAITDELASTLSCTGTEPFWSLTVEGEQAEFATPGEAPTSYRALSAIGSRNHRNIWSISLSGEAGSGVTFLEGTNRCSDGMSDFRYRYRLFLRFDDGRVYSGCCNQL